MLVAIAFLSLPVSHINGAFHRVEFVQARLSQRAQLLSRFAFDLTALVFCAVFVWQFIALVRSSWQFGDHAPTFLETPLWLPRSLLVIGMVGLCLSLARSLAADLQTFRRRQAAGAAMSPEIQLLMVTVMFLGLLTVGMPVPFAIVIPAVIYLFLQGGWAALNSLGLVSWGSMNVFALTAVPLFMFMAEILSASGLSTRIYGGLAKLVARLPGGLLQTNIAGCAVFASVNGSSIATAATIGGVALPQLLSRGYNRPLAAGSLAAGGTLGILIPPSFPMIIYGTFTETSVPKLFMAGVIPGLIMTACFMLYIAVHAKLDPTVAPREAGPASAGELLRALAEVVPFVLLILGTLGGLYFGVVTTTEAAVVGCALSIALGVTMGKLTVQRLVQAIFNTIIFSGNILFLILAAYIFSTALSFAGLGSRSRGSSSV